LARSGAGSSPAACRSRCRPLTRGEHLGLVLEAIAQCDKYGTDLYVKEDLWWAVPERRKARNKAMMRAKQRR